MLDDLQNYLKFKIFTELEISEKKGEKERKKKEVVVFF
jgi:hypothetical protein